MSGIEGEERKNIVIPLCLKKKKGEKSKKKQSSS